MVATPCGFESHHRHHVGASFISLAPTFFQKSEHAHAAAPPFQITTANAGLRFGFGCKPESCSIYTVSIFQLVASAISLATSFFISLQSSSYAHSAAPRFQIEPAALGFDLVLGTNLKTLSCILLGYSMWPQSSLCGHVFFIIATNPHCSTPLLSKLIPYCYRYLVDICSPACYNWFTKVDRREGEQWSIPH